MREFLALASTRGGTSGNSRLAKGERHFRPVPSKSKFGLGGTLLLHKRIPGMCINEKKEGEERQKKNWNARYLADFMSQ